MVEFQNKFANTKNPKNLRKGEKKASRKQKAASTGKKTPQAQTIRQKATIVIHFFKKISVYSKV